MQNIVNMYYQAIIQKDMNLINELLEDGFQMIHINGMIQTKEQFVQAILKDDIHYDLYSIQKIEETKINDKAMLEIKIKLVANLYHSGKRDWQLTSKMMCVKRNQWKIYRIIESY